MAEDVKGMTLEQLQARFAELMAVNQAYIERENELTEGSIWLLMKRM